MKSKINNVVVVHPADEEGKEALKEQYAKVISKILINRIPYDKIDEVLERLENK